MYQHITCATGWKCHSAVYLATNWNALHPESETSQTENITHRASSIIRCLGGKAFFGFRRDVAFISERVCGYLPINIY